MRWRVTAGRPIRSRESIDWVRTHDSPKFLESFYFQYGHASIADLGTSAVCFEGVSELAATEIEDEQLWDGQARSSRYQDFSKSGFITPPELTRTSGATYPPAAAAARSAITRSTREWCEYLAERLPRPEDMKPEHYRAQHRRASFRCRALRSVLRHSDRRRPGDQHPHAGAADPAIEGVRVPGSSRDRRGDRGCVRRCRRPARGMRLRRRSRWRRPSRGTSIPNEHAGAIAPGSRGVGRAESAAAQRRRDRSRASCSRPDDTHADIAATLLYPVTDRPFRELYEHGARLERRRSRNEVIDVALGSRTGAMSCCADSAAGLYAFDIVMDIGAYRDLHRHRRCQQFRQAYAGELGYDTPEAMAEAGLGRGVRRGDERDTSRPWRSCRGRGALLLPFGARSRFLFKMDFAEAEYIARLRSGVKGHFSYREDRLGDEAGHGSSWSRNWARLMEATPPWVEDPLRR